MKRAHKLMLVAGLVLVAALVVVALVKRPRPRPAAAMTATRMPATLPPAAVLATLPPAALATLPPAVLVTLPPAVLATLPAMAGASSARSPPPMAYTQGSPGPSGYESDDSDGYGLAG